MPDGDRFYRRLKGMGKGWISVSRIACNNGNIMLLDDSVLKAVANNLRSIEPASVESGIDILHSAFDEERWQKRNVSLSNADNFARLERAISVARFEGDSYLTKKFEESLKTVFLKYRKFCLTITKDEINERLGQTLAVEITNARLSCVRNEIMKEQNRTFSEQIKWEKELEKKISEPAKKLVKAFVNSKQTKKFRSPVTRRIDRNATSNILNRSLPAF
jgi:hypothetical protein